MPRYTVNVEALTAHLSDETVATANLILNTTNGSWARDVYVKADGSDEAMVFVSDRVVVQVEGGDTQSAYLTSTDPSEFGGDQGFSTGWEA